MKICGAWSLSVVVCTLLVVSGCATVASEPPPEVAPQPREMLAEEAVAEGMAATGRPPPPPPVSTGRVQRSGPDTLSTEQIRDQYEQSPMPLDFPQRVDHLHDRIYTWGQRFVQATDHRFAAKDKPLKPVPAAPFRLGALVEGIDRSGTVKVALDLDLDVSLQLPNIEERLRIFVTSDELDGGPRDTRQDSSVRAGLRYELVRDLDFDIGVRLNVVPVAFATLKWSRQVPMGKWDFYPHARLFIETKESLGYAAGTTFDRWSGRTLLRSSTFAKWRLDRERTEWSQTFIYARARELIVPDRYGSYPRATDIGRGWGVRLLASGENAHTVSRYESGLFFRSQTRNHSWLYWHVEPLVRWDRGYNWRADPGIRLGIDALFWGLARPAKRVSAR